MADQQLLAERERAPNGCIVAAVTDPATIQSNNNDISKLKNCSNGDVNGLNSINQKNGSTNKIIYEFSTNETPSQNEVPDGGARAWCVMISAFFCNSIIFGIINTCGSVYVKLYDHLTELGDAEAASKACKYVAFSFEMLELFFFVICHTILIASNFHSSSRTKFRGSC